MDKTLKLTDWYPGTVEPKRTGWYQRDYFDTGYEGEDGCLWFSRWDGQAWHVASDSLDCNYDSMISPHQYLPWRGIKK